ncbi:MAG: glycosyltransferase family 39 protein [Anaerolineales bacterium]
MSRLKRGQVSWLWITVGVFSILAAALVLLATRQGAGVTADSIVYYNAADFLLEGKGISRLAAEVGYKPVTHFPPLYPAVLAGMRLLGFEIDTAARMLNAGLLFGLVWLTAYLLPRREYGPWTRVVGAALVGLSPILLDVFSWAMSEPLYIAAMLLSLAGGSAYLRSGDRKSLVLAGLAAAAAYLTRYSGLAGIACLGAVFLFLPTQPWRRKMMDLVIFVITAIGPVVMWMVRNLIVAGSATNRQLAWHPISLTELKRWFHILFAWLLPFEFTHSALLFTIGVFALFLAGILLVQFRNRFQPLAAYLKQLPDHPLRLLTGWFSLIYALMIMASISLFDASTPLNFRITSPMYVSLLLYALTHMPGRLEWYRDDRRHRLAMLMIILLVGSYAYRSVALASELSKDAQGYASSLLIPSSQVELIQSLPDDIVIYSNNLEAMYYFYDRAALIVPSETDAVSQLENEGFSQELDAMRLTLASGRGVLIIFYSRQREGYPPPVLVEGLELIYNQYDVMIFTGSGMGERFYPE